MRFMYIMFHVACDSCIMCLFYILSLSYTRTHALFLYTLGETKKWKSLKLKEQDFRICTEILIKAYNRFKCAEVFSKERRRKFGVSKVNKIQDGINLLFNILKHYLN